MSYKKAHLIAGKTEVKGMTKKQILQYCGRLGAIARWRPRQYKKR
jgi:hypothetical protein